MAQPLFDKTSPRGRPRGHGIAYFLARVGDEELRAPDGLLRTKNELVAKKAFMVLLAKETSTRDFITLLSEVIDRRDGKAIAFAVTHDTNFPLADIDSNQLQRLRDKLQVIQEAVVVPAEPVPPAEEKPEISHG